MIRGRDQITITDAPTSDNPHPEPRTAKVHISWNGGEETRVQQGDSPSYSVYLQRYITATYGKNVTIPQECTVTFMGDNYEPTGPEEVHTDMRGRISHKTRRLLWTERIE